MLDPDQKYVQYLLTKLWHCAAIPDDISGDEVKKHRGQLKMSQQTLADRLGVDRVTVARWEIGKVEPPKHVVELLERFVHEQEQPKGPLTPDGIKALRKRLKMTQEEFGNAVGVTRETVTRWERGVFPPSGVANQLMGMLEIMRGRTMRK